MCEYGRSLVDVYAATSGRRVHEHDEGHRFPTAPEKLELIADEIRRVGGGGDYD